MREPRHTALTGTGGPASSTTSAISPLRFIGSILRGLLEGALPALILVATGALFWEIMTIVRLVTAPYGFPVTQTSELIAGVLGVLVGLIVFVVAGVRTLNGVRDRHLNGDYVESTVAMIVLLISLIYVFSTLMSLIGAPQHPAP